MILKIDTTISELSPARLNEAADYLIKFREEYADDGALREELPYTAEKIKIKSLIDYTLSNDRTVTGHWTFNNPPEQTTRYGIDDYVNNILLNPDNRNDCITLTGNGYYARNGILFPEEYASTSSSLSVSQYSVPNLDYVHRVAAYIYNSLKNQIDKYRDLNLIPSKVGEIIFTTTLSTESMVKDLYGKGQVLLTIGDLEIRAPDTHWELTAKHMLVSGAGNNHQNDDSYKHPHNDGYNSAGTAVTIDKTHHFKAHGHTEYKVHGVGHSHGSVSASVKDSSTYITEVSTGKKRAHKRGPGGAVKSYSIATGTVTDNFGTGEVNTSSVAIDQNTKSGIGGVNSYNLNIEQAYKNVYIWKRTS